MTTNYLRSDNTSSGRKIQCSRVTNLKTIQVDGAVARPGYSVLQLARPVPVTAIVAGRSGLVLSTPECGARGPRIVPALLSVSVFFTKITAIRSFGHTDCSA